MPVEEGYPIRLNAAWEMVGKRRVNYNALGHKATEGGVVPAITPLSLVDTREGSAHRVTLDHQGYFGEEVDLHTVNYLDSPYCQIGSKICERLVTITSGIPLLIVTCESPERLFQLAKDPYYVIPRLVLSTAAYDGQPASNFGQETGTYLFDPNDAQTDGMLARGHLRMSKPQPYGPASSRRWEQVQILTRQDRLQPRALTAALRSLSYK